MIDLKKFVVFGYRTTYHTHTHIHYGIAKALQFMGRDGEWTQQNDGRDWRGTVFVTNHDWVTRLPLLSPDCFYVVHGLNDYPELRDMLREKTGNHCLSWNVFHDYCRVYGSQGNPQARGIYTNPTPTTDCVWLDEDIPFFPNERHMDFRWATDLTPPEIERNKKHAMALNRRSNIIHYVGTYWHVNEKEIAEFARACREGNIELRHSGAGQDGMEHHWLGWPKVVSPEDNQKLVRDSFFAPAIVGSHHLTEGYLPCRAVKNASYGRMVATNSKRVNDVFGGRLVFDPDPYKLFFEARERMASISVSEVHALMNLVSEKHTYLNRLNAVVKAIEYLL